MAQDHFIRPTVPDAPTQAVRLGAGNSEGDRYDYREVGKFVKLVGESRYSAVAVGNDIEAAVYAVELAPQNGYSIGSILKAPETKLYVTFDGAQADGSGVLAIGDIVVAGTPVAKGTALSGADQYPKVRKATTPANVVHKWRVVSLGAAGTGAAGTVGVIEKL